MASTPPKPAPAPPGQPLWRTLMTYNPLAGLTSMIAERPAPLELVDLTEQQEPAAASGKRESTERKGALMKTSAKKKLRKLTWKKLHRMRKRLAHHNAEQQNNIVALKNLAEDEEVAVDFIKNVPEGPKSPTRSDISVITNIAGTSEGGALLPGLDWMNTNDELMIWPPKDISGGDISTYTETLLTYVVVNKQLLTHELQHLCRMNFYKRLDVLCDIMDQKCIRLEAEWIREGVPDSLLHLALLYDSTEAAKVLIKYGGAALVMLQLDTKDFRGTTHLHKAIKKRNREIIRVMMECLSESQRKWILHQQAIGKYFKGSTALPLTLAAVNGDKDLFDDLVQYGAEVDKVEDKNGFNVIHSLIHFLKYDPARAKDMFQHIMNSKAVQKWWLKRRDLVGLKMTPSESFNMKQHLLKTTNFDGYTPLTMSAAEGNVEMCETIMQTLHVYKHPQWTIGPTSCHYFDISEIDQSVVNFGKPCVVDLFLYGSVTKYPNYCQIPVIKEIFVQKWRLYRVLFYLWFVFHLLVMIDLTVSLEVRASSRNRPEQNPGNTMFMTTQVPLSKTGFTFFPEEFLVLFAATLYFIADLYDIVKYSARSLFAVWKVYRARGRLPSINHSAVIWWPEAFRLILFLFSFSYILALLLRMNNNDWEPIFMSGACLFGWVFLLSFARATKNIGIFTIMLLRMLIGDMVHFCLVFLVFLMAFSTAFRVLFIGNSTIPIPEDIRDIQTTLYNTWHFTVGLRELNIFEDAAHPTAVKVLFLGFVLCANILLFNMLIAAMSDTYTFVAGQKKNLWLSLRGQSVAMIEQHLPKCIRPELKLQHRQRKDCEGRVRNMWLLLVKENSEGEE